MESLEKTPANGIGVPQQRVEDCILVNSLSKVLDKRDAIATPFSKKIQPIKIVIPSSTSTPNFPQTNYTTPKMIISPVQLSAQPTVSVKLGSNQLNVKMVTNASLFQNSLTSPAINGVSELPIEAETMSSPQKQKKVSESTDISFPMTPNSTDTNRDDSPAKMTREQKQLQDSINSSLVLSQMIIGGGMIRKSRGRKKKSQSPKQLRDPSLDPQRLSRSKSMDVLNKESKIVRSRQPSRSRNSILRSRSGSPTDQDSENDQGNTPKRHNMRSANAEFAQKQKSFMKEIIKTQESADEIERSEDDEAGQLVKTNSNKSITVVENLPQAPKVNNSIILISGSFIIIFFIFTEGLGSLLLALLPMWYFRR